MARGWSPPVDPQSNADDAQVLTEKLVVGTDLGVIVSADDACTGHALGDNFPATVERDLEEEPDGRLGSKPRLWHLAHATPN